MNNELKDKIENMSKEEREKLLEKINERINYLDKKEMEENTKFPELGKYISKLCQDNINLKVKLTKYMSQLLNLKEEDLIEILNKLTKYEDIFQEFINYLLSGKIIKNDKSICEQNYTAYDILVKEPCLLTHTAFLWLAALREKNENIMKILETGIPVSSAVKLSYNMGKIKNYLKSKNLTDPVVKVLMKPYYKHPDIANEFEFYIRTSKFIEDNPIIECGYTAKKIYEDHKDKLDIAGVFATLISLRNNPEKALNDIARNFPTK